MMLGGVPMRVMAPPSSAPKESGISRREGLILALPERLTMAGSSTAEIEAEYLSNGSLDKADVAFFEEMLRGVLLNSAELDAILAPALDRKINELNNVERAALRAATRELSTREDIPYPVVINEYVELTKLFGAEDGHKFVNGVLDKLATSLRPLEVAARERV